MQETSSKEETLRLNCRTFVALYFVQTRGFHRADAFLFAGLTFFFRWTVCFYNFISILIVEKKESIFLYNYLYKIIFCMNAKLSKNYQIIHIVFNFAVIKLARVLKIILFNNWTKYTWDRVYKLLFFFYNYKAHDCTSQFFSTLLLSSIHISVNGTSKWMTGFFPTIHWG